MSYQPHPTCTQQWSLHRRWWWAKMVSMPLLAAGIILMFARWPPRRYHAAPQVWLVVCAIALYAIVDYKVGAFRCPRCHSEFYRKGAGVFNYLVRGARYFYNPFASRCQQCSLKKWQC